MSSSTIGRVALEELRVKGVAVMRKVIPPHLVKALAAEVDAQRHYLEQAERAALYRINMFLLKSPGHIGFLCPFNDIFCNKELLTSEPLIDLLEAYLGKDFYLHEYVVNVSLAAGNTSQEVHVDQEPHPRGTVGVVVNIALSVTGPENGMTRLWPGSIGTSPHDSDSLNTYLEPSQPTLYPGDILIRDLSILHQGVPNPSEEDRSILGLVMKPAWQEADEKVTGEISQSVWDTWTVQQQRIMRRHRVVPSEWLCARPYPIPVSAPVLEG